MPNNSVLLHDALAFRTSGVDGDIRLLQWREFQNILTKPYKQRERHTVEKFMGEFHGFRTIFNLRVTNQFDLVEPYHSSLSTCWTHAVKMLF